MPPALTSAGLAAQVWVGTAKALQTLPVLRQLPQRWANLAAAEGATGTAAIRLWIVALAGLVVAPLISFNENGISSTLRHDRVPLGMYPMRYVLLLCVVLLGVHPSWAQANNFGKVCPPAMTPQQAGEAGCRFIGSVTGYDICANPVEYDPNAFTINYNPAVLNDIIATTGNFGLVIALAHEEGHNVQMLRGRYMSFIPRGLGRELDADRLAGSFLRWAQEHGFLHQCDFAAAVLAIFRAGDQAGDPAFDPQAHSSPAQRARAVMQGYLHGAEPF